MKSLNVVGAILIENNEILCAQRGKGKYEYISYKYEFPGGKIEEGETPQEALQRELIEEMSVNISVQDMEHFYTVKHVYPDFALTMDTFICRLSNRSLTLTEHLDIKWLPLEKLHMLDWAAADWPIVRELERQGASFEYC